MWISEGTVQLVRTGKAGEESPDRRGPGGGVAVHPGRRGPWRVPLLATAVVLPLYGVWATVLATGGGDLAAQLAWAGFMARHPDSAYNLSWYGGTHTANYSLLAPPLMALLGVRTVSVAVGIAGTWAMALLLVRAGVARAVWPALLGAAVLWCNVASGRTTFALGAAVGLFALLTGGRTARSVTGTVLLAGLTAMASPVAALFLLVAGAGYLLDGRWVRAATLVLPPVVIVAAVTLLFPFEGEQPMAAAKLWMPLAACAAVWFAAPRDWRVVRYAAAVYAVGVVLTFMFASPVGTNVERLVGLAGPPVLLAAVLTRGAAWAADRPVRDPLRAWELLRSLAPLCARDLRRVLPMLTLVTAVAVNTGWVVNKTDDDLEVSSSVPAWAARSQGVIAELNRLGAERTRVEVVPARNHREADILAPHLNMARGWNRQLDVERGRLFYDGSMTQSAYRAWLDRWAVGLVVLPHAQPDSPAEAEAWIVRSRPGWLTQVWQDSGWTVYRVRDAVPLVSAPATVVRGSAADLVVRMPAAGSVTVRIAYSPWLRAPGACVRRAGDWTRLTVGKGGDYRLDSAYRLPRTNGCDREPPRQSHAARSR